MVRVVGCGGGVCAMGGGEGVCRGVWGGEGCGEGCGVRGGEGCRTPPPHGTPSPPPHPTAQTVVVTVVGCGGRAP